MAGAESTTFVAGGTTYTLTRQAVMSATARVQPERPLGRPNTAAWFVTIRRRRYPVKQVLRLALDLTGASIHTSHAASALTRLGFRVTQDDR